MRWLRRMELRLRRRQYARAVSDLRCEQLAFDERVAAAIRAGWLRDEIAMLEWFESEDAK